MASSTAAITKKRSSSAFIRSIWIGKNCHTSWSPSTFGTSRFEDIRHFERYLTRNGTIVRKFFLHVSKDEQKKRFLERLENPDKNWKYSASDMKERAYWGDYMAAYEEAIQETATDEAPWYVVPADNKWFTRVVVAAAIIDALGSINLKYPEVAEAQRKDLEAAKAALLKN